MTSQPEERGTLNPGQSVTLYAGTDAKTLRIHLSGLIQPDAKLDVLVNGATEGALTKNNTEMHANGTNVRLHNAGSKGQNYQYDLV